MSVADEPDRTGAPLRTLEPQAPPRRRFTSRFGILHVIAVASGLLAFLLILSWMRSQEDLIEVVVATDVVRSGNVVGSQMFDVVEIPATASFGGSLVAAADLATVDGSVATRTISPGEPLLASDLRAVQTPVGLRAMSVPLDANQAVGGDLATGDRVDVIGFDDSGPHYIATEVEVLDVPGEASGAFGATSSFAVTLAVDDVQALALAAGLDAGPVHILRSTGAPGVTLERLATEADDDDGDDGGAG